MFTLIMSRMVIFSYCLCATNGDYSHIIWNVIISPTIFFHCIYKVFM